MNQLQAEILKVYKAFKKTCDENNLSYYAAFGTALGAVRHQGFIPWDDDIDVHMPYSDCLQLLEIIQSGDNSLPISIRDRSSDEDSKANIFKIYSKNSTYIENLECRPQDFYGVFVDVFPLIGTPEAEDERKDYFQEITRLKKDIFWHETLGVRDKDTEIQQLTELFGAYPYWEASKVASAELWLGRWEYDRSDFEKLLEMQFEDTTIPVCNQYDEHLTSIYGDYMKLPPQSQRTGHHAARAYIDISRPFSFYSETIEQPPLKEYVGLLQTEISVLKKDLSNKSQKVDSLWETIDPLNEEIRSLRKEIKRLKQQITSLENPGMMKSSRLVLKALQARLRALVKR